MQANISAPDPSPFPSLAALRDAHARLVDSFPQPSSSPEFLTQVQAFLESGRKSGVYLGDRQERFSAQTLLDYWATLIYQVGQPPIKTKLVPFDAAVADQHDLKNVASPYRGLEAFHEEHHHLFFGRELLIHENMLGRLKAHRFLAVLGASGSGKSSLVLGGLVPALKLAEPREFSHYLFMVPTADPIGSLANTLWQNGLDISPEDWRAQLRAESQALTASIQASSNGPMLLVIDQFEETFTLCTDMDDRQAFFNNLLALVQSPDSGHAVVFTMRSEIYEQEQHEFPEALRTLCEKSNVRVTSLYTADLIRAVEKPAEMVGLKFEKGVVDQLISDLKQEREPLPLLQFALLKLWEGKEGNRVTMAAYRRLGGCLKALATSADEVYRKFENPEGQATLKRTILRLLTPGEGVEVTRNRFTRQQLHEGEAVPSQVDQVLEAFVEARLFRQTDGHERESDQFEVTHEALTRYWPLLVGWIDEKRGALKLRRNLEEKAKEWNRLEGQGGLLDEFQLEEAQRWLTRIINADLTIQDDVLKLIKASYLALEDASRKRAAQVAETEAARVRELQQVQALAEAQRKANRRLFGLVTALALALIAFIGAYFYTNVQFNIAKQQKTIADNLTQRAVANNQRLTRLKEETSNNNEKLSELVHKAVEDGKRASRTADERLRRASKTAEERLRRANWTATEIKKQAQEDVRLAQAQLVNAQSAVGQADKRVALAIEKLKESQQNLQIVQAKVRSSRQSIKLAKEKFERAKRELRAAEAARKTAITEREKANEASTKAREQLSTARALQQEVRKEAQATTLALNSELQLIRPVDFLPLSTALGIESLREMPTVSGMEAIRNSLKLLARPIKKIERQAPVVAVASMPSGAIIVATQNEKGTAEISMVGVEGKTLWRKVIENISKVDISPGGVSIALIDAHGDLQIFKTGDKGLTPVETPILPRSMEHIAFSADGKSLIAVERIGIGYVWKTLDSAPETFTPSREYGPERITAVAISNPTSGESTFIAMASSDPAGKVSATRIWENTVKISKFIEDPDASMLASGRINSLAFSADGHFLASGSGNNFVQRGTKTAVLSPLTRIWDVQSRQEIQRIAHPLGVTAVSFSPDGNSLLTGCADDAARLWDIFSGHEIVRMSSDNDVSAAIFAADGKSVVTGSHDRTVRVWEPTPFQSEVKIIGRPTNPENIYSSDDGQYKALKTDGILKIFKSGSREEDNVGQIPLNVPLDDYLADGFRANDVLTNNLPENYFIQINDKGELTLETIVASSLGSINFPQATIRTLGRPSFLSFSPDGKYLATASSDSSVPVQIWDLNRLNEDQMSNLAFASSDENFEPRSAEVARFKHDGKLTGISFSTDGKYLIAAGEDVLATLWPWQAQDLVVEASQRLTRNLSQAQWKQFFGDEAYRKTNLLLPAGS